MENGLHLLDEQLPIFYISEEMAAQRLLSSLEEIHFTARINFHEPKIETIFCRLLIE
ncbi:MAG: hypothetical protein AB1394_05900 [Bacteroidota bacterium]